MSLTKHTGTATVAFAAAILSGLAVYYMASRVDQPPATSAIPSAATFGVPAALAPAKPLEVVDSNARRLAEENADLRARLAAVERELDARARESIAAEDKLAELRRPLEANIISSTLRAIAVQPGEVVVTGGALLPNGKRLYSFAQPVRKTINGQEVVEIDSRVLALNDAGADAGGLADFKNSAANTIQHGQVWSKGEFASGLEKMQAAEGTELMHTPKIMLIPGGEGSISIGQDSGSMLQIKVAPRLNPEGRGVDMDLRVQFDAGQQATP